MSSLARMPLHSVVICYQVTSECGFFRNLCTKFHRYHKCFDKDCDEELEAEKEGRLEKGKMEVIKRPREIRVEFYDALTLLQGLSENKPTNRQDKIKIIKNKQRKQEVCL